DLFTPDGRIITRLTGRRKAIFAKLFGNEPFARAARTYWYKRSGVDRRSVRLDPPSHELERWELREMIGSGLAWRGGRSGSGATGGHDVYKGENILAGA
ncbi:hypothetical protein ACNJU8_21255, partial [Mycobacterium tuberculosis]